MPQARGDGADTTAAICRQLVELSGPDTQPRNQAILGFLENALGIDALKAQVESKASVAVVRGWVDGVVPEAKLKELEII